MDRPTPAAFLSYVRFDDEHEEGRLTQLRERLSGEVRMQTGEPFPIFQDRNDIGWGQNWRERIERSLDEVTFLIPVVTPSFLTSDACQEELRIFLEREKALERNDLILPLYYVDSPILNDKRSSGQDPLAQAITEHQYADWRDLRFEPLTSAQVGVALARLAVQIRDALARAKDSKATSRPETPKVGAAGGEGTGPETSSPPESKEPPGQTGLVATTEAQQGPRRPSPKTEPPVRVVDPFHRGDHASIGEALTAANPGDRILVRPGLYKEGLVIEKPLEIIGDGDVNDIVIQATGQHAVSFRTMMGRVANLSLQQAGGGDWYGVDIAQGRLELEECDITSQSWACVAIHGGADPRVRDNRIHDSLRGGGVLVYENSQGVIEGNDIFGNAVVAVEIKDGSNPTLRRNRIHEGQSGGVMVHTDAVGTFEDNDIFGNALAGVAITEGGNPTLRRNRIHDGQGAGVLVNKKGLGTLEDNEIFSNALAGVAITEGGNPTLRRNRIHGGQPAGVLVLKPESTEGHRWTA